MTSSRRIAVLLPDLRPGGAEKMRLHLARQWMERGFGVEFVLRRKQGELLQLVPEGASVVDLGVDRVRTMLGPLIRYLSAKQPDALLAAMWPMTVVAPLAARLSGFRGRVVVSEHNNMTAAYRNRGRGHGAMMRASMGLSYSLADAVVAVSEGVAQDLARLSRRDRSAFHVIYNPACTETIIPMPAEGAAAHGPKTVLTVGSLKTQKRHDLLLEAFARLPASVDAQLVVVGSGELRTALEDQARALGIGNKVVFAGYQADTRSWYAKADLFVLCSDYEGFGNVIVEALEMGVPVVSTDCPSGPREILADGRYGRLVPTGDIEALRDAILESLQTTHERMALRARALDFSVERVAGQYLDLMFPDKQPQRNN
jgi:Glycosyltransferase